MSKRGRPSKYTEKVADEILRRIADGESLRSICEDDKMPAPSTVCMWAIKDEPPGFYEHYTRARKCQAEVMSDDLLEIADAGGDVNRDRLRIDTRKWVLGKIYRERYGKATKLEHSGQVEVPGLTVVLSGDVEA